MDYIHVKNLEKYHPGYKDRDLKWAKLYFWIVQGDAEFEMIEDEIDKWRFCAMVCLELENKKPLPNSDRYWSKKGFDVNKRPMSLTINMLHKHIDIVTASNLILSTSNSLSQSEDLGKGGEGEKPQPPGYIDGNLPQLPIQVLEHYNVLADMWRAAGVVVETYPAQTAYTMYVRGAVDWTESEKAGRNYLNRCRAEGRAGKFYKSLPSFLEVWKDWLNPPAAADPGKPPADIVCRKCGVTKIKVAGGMCRACIRQMEVDAAAEKAAYNGATDSPGAKKFMEEVRKLTEEKRVTGISGSSGKYPCTGCGQEHNDTLGALCRPCSADLLKKQKRQLSAD